MAANIVESLSSIPQKASSPIGAAPLNKKIKPLDSPACVVQAVYSASRIMGVQCEKSIDDFGVCLFAGTLKARVGTFDSDSER